MQLKLQTLGAHRRCRLKYVSSTVQQKVNVWHNLSPPNKSRKTSTHKVKPLVTVNFHLCNPTLFGNLWIFLEFLELTCEANIYLVTLTCHFYNFMSACTMPKTQVANACRPEESIVSWSNFAFEFATRLKASGFYFLTSNYDLLRRVSLSQKQIWTSQRVRDILGKYQKQHLSLEWWGLLTY
jgi:hypothetical protein